MRKTKNKTRGKKHLWRKNNWFEFHREICLMSGSLGKYLMIVWLTDWQRKKYKHLIISISPLEHRKFTEKNKIKFRLINNKTEFNEIWFLIFAFASYLNRWQFCFSFHYSWVSTFNACVSIPKISLSLLTEC